MNKPLNQQIRERFSLGPAHHMTHIENLDGILKAKAIQSFNRMRGNYTNIANEDVQLGRSAILIQETGRPLHDYVPLYFGFKTPMVACNQRQNEELIFLRFSLDILSEISGIVFSNGNARSTATQFRPYQKLDDLTFLDLKAVLSVKYASDAELKRKKQAELLIPDALDTNHMLDIICFSEHSRNTVITILKQYAISVSVRINPGWYFVPTQKGVI